MENPTFDWGSDGTEYGKKIYQWSIQVHVVYGKNAIWARRVLCTGSAVFLLAAQTSFLYTGSVDRGFWGCWKSLFLNNWETYSVAGKLALCPEYLTCLRMLRSVHWADPKQSAFYICTNGHREISSTAARKARSEAVVRRLAPGLRRPVGNRK